MLSNYFSSVEICASTANVSRITRNERKCCQMTGPSRILMSKQLAQPKRVSARRVELIRRLIFFKFSFHAAPNAHYSKFSKSSLYLHKVLIKLRITKSKKMDISDTAPAASSWQRHSRREESARRDRSQYHVIVP